MRIGAIIANVANAVKKAAGEAAEHGQSRTAFPRAVNATAGPSQHQPSVIPVSFQVEPVSVAPSITDDVKKGKSIHQIASERGLTYDETVAQLRAEGYEVQTTDPTSDNGDVRTTVIHNPATGENVTEYYDFQHDNYTTEQKSADGTQIHSPMRDGLGRKVTTSYDQTTGAATTRYEDDLGNGDVIERTTLPDGTLVEKIIAPGGRGSTTVIAPDGKRTILAASQTPTRAGAKPIIDGIAQGKTIEEVARENGLTTEQVVAQLRAAGYNVTTQQPTGDNGSVAGTRITDQRTNTVVAAAYHDQEHDMRTTQHVDGNGNTVIRTTDSDGTVTVRVQSPDGRETRTVTAPDGKKTVYETANGHTLTTASDGSLTLTNNTTGIQIKIQAGTPEAALVRLFMNADPTSSNPVKAREGQVITAIVGQMMVGKKLPEAIAAVKQAGQHTQAMIDKYGAGVPATPNKDTVSGVEDPIGLPPTAKTKSGGKWVPVLIDGSWFWFDPKVAEAMAAESVATGEANALIAQLGQYQGQLDVYALDPAYAGAVKSARGKINTALRPLGLELKPLERPAGTLQEAQDRLTTANAQLGQANGALSQYRSAQSTLATAIEKWNHVQPQHDPRQQSFDSRDHPINWTVENARRRAEQVEVEGLFSTAGTQQAQGDQLTLDFLIALTGTTAAPEGVPLKEITVGGRTLKVTAPVADAYYRDGVGALLNSDQPIGIQITVPDGRGGTTQEWRWVAPDYAIGKLQADRNVQLAVANGEFFSAYGTSADWEARSQEIQGRLLAEYNARNPHLFEPGKKHSTVGGDYLGEFKGQRLEFREGNQLWVVNEFEDGKTEQQLTSGLDTRTHGSEYRDRPLNREWQQFIAGMKPDPSTCAAPVSPQGIKVGAVNAGRTLTDLKNNQLTIDLAELGNRIDGLSKDLTDAIGKHGTGTTDLPPGAFPDGVTPVEIDVGGTRILVAPDVAARYRTMGLDALLQSEQPIFIQLDLTPGDNDSSKQGRWVNPEVAVAQIRLNAARAEQDAKETMQTRLVNAHNWYDLVLSEPHLLLNSDPSEDMTYVTEQERLALEGIYQPQFQEMLANDPSGLFTVFRPMDGGKLDTLVRGTFGPNASGKVRDEIIEAGGDTPQVRVTPMFLVDPTYGSQQTALIAVQDKNDPSKTWYVDATGRRFSSLEEFQGNNELFSPDAKLVVPVGLNMTPGSDGKVALDVVNARNLSFQEKYVDPAIGIATSVLTVASFALPVLAPFALAGGLYLGVRAGQRQYDYVHTGGEWGDRQSIMNMGMIVTSVLPVGSAGFRTIGMMRNLGLSFPRAALAGTGAMRTTGTVNAAAGAGAPSRLWNTVPHVREVGPYLGTAGGFNRAAHVTDAGAMVVGTPLMVDGAYNLIVHGDQMNGLQLVEAITGTLTGAVGTGLGARGLWAHFRADKGRFLNLEDADGQGFKAFVQGEAPSPDKIYIPVGDVTTVRMDDPAIVGRTHTVVRDTETGQYFVVPLRLRPVRREAEATLAADRPSLNYAGDGLVTVAGRQVDPRFVEMSVSPDAFLVIARAGELPALDKLAADITDKPDYRPGQDVVIYVSGSGGRLGSETPVLAAFARDLAKKLGSRVHLVDGDNLHLDAQGLPAVTGRPAVPQFKLTNGLWVPGSDTGAQPILLVSDNAHGPAWRGQPIDPLHLGVPQEPQGTAGGGIPTYRYRNGRWFDAVTGEQVSMPSLLEPGRSENPARYQAGFNLERFLRLIANDNHAHHGGLNRGNYLHLPDGMEHPHGLRMLLEFTGASDDARQGPYVGVQRVPQAIHLQAGYYLGRARRGSPTPVEFTILHHSDGSFSIPKNVTYFGMGEEPRTISKGQIVLGRGGVKWDGGAVPQVPLEGQPAREYTVNVIPDFDMTYRGRQRDVGLIDEIRGLPEGYDRRVLMGAVAPDPADPINVSHFLGTLNHANQTEGFKGQVRIFGIGEWTWAKEGVIVNLALKPDLYRPESIHQMLGVLGEIGGTVVVHTDSGRPNMITLPNGEKLLLHTQSNDENIQPLLDIFRQHGDSNLQIVWAHGGGLGRSNYPGPRHLEMLRQVLSDPTLRHVSIDLSWDVVSTHVARDVPGWAKLIREFPDRFIHGTDSVAAEQPNTHFAALDTYLRSGLLDQLGRDTTLQFLRDNFERIFVPSADNITNWRLRHADWLRQFPSDPDQPGGGNPFDPAGPFGPMGPNNRALWTPDSESSASNTLFVVSGQGRPEPRRVGTDNRGYVNYLGDGAVTVNGERVDPSAIHVTVPPESFLVIARGDGSGGMLDPAGNPLSMDKLVDDLASSGHRPGQDVVLYVCGAGTRSETSNSPVTRSIAQELADRLGVRAHAVDGDIIVGETVDLSGPAVTERPGLPLIDISNGAWREQQNYAAQRAFWINGKRGEPVAEPFATPPLTYIRKDGSSVDPFHLGPLDDLNPLSDGSPAGAINSADFAFRGGLIILKAIYGNKVPSLAADRPLGVILRSNLLATYLVNDTVFTQWVINGGLTHIDPNKPVALQVMEKAFILGFGMGNTLLTGTTTAELVGGSRKWTWDTPTTQGFRATGMSLLTLAAPFWTTHTGMRAIDQIASGDPVTGTALTVATLMEGVFTYAMGRAALNEWARVRKDPSYGSRNLKGPHVMLGSALFFATGIQVGLAYYEAHKEMEAAADTLTSAKTAREDAQGSLDAARADLTQKQAVLKQADKDLTDAEDALKKASDAEKQAALQKRDDAKLKRDDAQRAVDKAFSVRGAMQAKVDSAQRELEAAQAKFDAAKDKYDNLPF